MRLLKIFNLRRLFRKKRKSIHLIVLIFGIIVLLAVPVIAYHFGKNNNFIIAQSTFPNVCGRVSCQEGGVAQVMCTNACGAPGNFCIVDRNCSQIRATCSQDSDCLTEPFNGNLGVRDSPKSYCGEVKCQAGRCVSITNSSCNVQSNAARVDYNAIDEGNCYEYEGGAFNNYNLKIQNWTQFRNDDGVSTNVGAYCDETGKITLNFDYEKAIRPGFGESNQPGIFIYNGIQTNPGPGGRLCRYGSPGSDGEFWDGASCGVLSPGQLQGIRNSGMYQFNSTDLHNGRYLVRVDLNGVDNFTGGNTSKRCQYLVSRSGGITVTGGDIDGDGRPDNQCEDNTFSHRVSGKTATFDINGVLTLNLDIEYRGGTRVSNFNVRMWSNYAEPILARGFTPASNTGTRVCNQVCTNNVCDNTYFVDLPEGMGNMSCSINETLPTNTNTTVTYRMEPGTSTFRGTNGSWYTVEVVANYGSCAKTFTQAVQCKPRLPQTGSIRVNVWEDKDGNGINDDGNSTLPQVTVGATGQSNKTIGPNGGSTVFEPLNFATYDVSLTIPAGYALTTPPSPRSVELAANPPERQNAIVNFGLRKIPGNAISGRVWYDYNFNGVIDGGDRPYSAPPYVAMSMRAEPGGHPGTINTDGTYTIEDVPDGTYTLDTVPDVNESSYKRSFPTYYSVTMSGTSRGGFDFLIQPYSIRGKAFLDNNRDCIFQPGEPFVKDGRVDVQVWSSADPRFTISQATPIPIISHPTNQLLQYNYVLGANKAFQVLDFTVPPGYIINPSCGIGTQQSTSTVGPPQDLNFLPVDWPMLGNGTIRGRLIVDYDYNCAQNTSAFGTDALFPSATNVRIGTEVISFTGGQFERSNLLPGTYPVNVTVPSGYVMSSCSANPQNASVPPDANLSFYITPQYMLKARTIVDNNHNGVLDAGDAPYSAGPLRYTLSGAASRVGDTTNPPDFSTFEFKNLLSGNYNVALNVPSGYRLIPVPPAPNNTNPRDGIVLNADKTVDFFIAPVFSITVNVRELLNSGIGFDDRNMADASVTLSKTSGTAPFIPPSQTQVTSGSGQVVFSNLFASTYSVRLERSGSILANHQIVQIVQNGSPMSRPINSQDTGNINVGPSYTFEYRVTPIYTISGTVQVDTSNNQCSPGIAFTTSVNIEANGSNPTGFTTRTVQSNGPGGAYQFNSNLSLAQQLSTGRFRLTNGSGLRVRRITVTPPDRAVINASAVQFENYPPQWTRSIDICLTYADPWYRTYVGDVRKMSKLELKVPGTLRASDDPTNLGNPGANILSSLFFSSTNAVDIRRNGVFDIAALSQKRWRVEREYEYSNTKSEYAGTLSYAYLYSLEKRKGVTINDLAPLCSGGCPNGALNNLSGVYRFNGNLRIRKVDLAASKRLVILATGTIEIDDSVKVHPSSVLVVASGADIVINKEVGAERTNYASNDSTLDGIFTAHGSIVTKSYRPTGDKCDLTNPGRIYDRRLIVSGSIIANAHRPFSKAGGGAFDIGDRSLCEDDALYPVVQVIPRLSFVTLLDDIYKSRSTRWKEIEP